MEFRDPINDPSRPDEEREFRLSDSEQPDTEKKIVDQKEVASNNSSADVRI